MLRWNLFLQASDRSPKHVGLARDGHSDLRWGVHMRWTPFFYAYREQILKHEGNDAQIAKPLPSFFPALRRD